MRFAAVFDKCLSVLSDFVAALAKKDGPMASDPIKHIVVLMLENRSFDQVLGCMQEIYPQLDGANPATRRVNRDDENREYRQEPRARPAVRLDPRHEHDHVAIQLADDNGGFVRDLARSYGVEAQPDDLQAIMDYFPLGTLPAIHTLAQHFTICDHWYSSVPGPTWANRFFVHSGTSLGRVKMGSTSSLEDAALFFGYDQETIYDRLDGAGVTWNIYSGDIPQSILMSRLFSRLPQYRLLAHFYEHASRAESDFPQYAFIEPRYFPPDQNDDHPPHNSMRSQELIASVYNAIRRNDELWKSTLLVVLYDEHGGFYDHALPPACTPPDDSPCNEGCRFDQLGVRVPALLVSPWVERGFIDTHFDHTSLLRYVSDKWNLRTLSNRVKAANSFAAAIRTTGTPRTDTPSSIIMPAMRSSADSRGDTQAMRLVQPLELNENQKGLVAYLQQRANPPSPLDELPNGRSMAITQRQEDPEVAKAQYQQLLASARQQSDED